MQLKWHHGNMAYLAPVINVDYQEINSIRICINRGYARGISQSTDHCQCFIGDAYLTDKRIHFRVIRAGNIIESIAHLKYVTQSATIIIFIMQPFNSHIKMDLLEVGKKILLFAEHCLQQYVSFAKCKKQIKKL